MEVPHKGGYEIVNYNPRRTYCPLVPKKRVTFYVTDGSPQRVLIYFYKIFTIRVPTILIKFS